MKYIHMKNQIPIGNYPTKKEVNLMNVFIYHRPVHKEFYEMLARQYFSEYNMITLSDFKESADIWLGTESIKQLNEECELFTNEEKRDILLRCRFLRNIDENIAKNLIDQMSIKLDNLISEYKPRFIIGAVIDNYTMDIMERLSAKYNIPYVSFLGHFFSGYSWITKRGELNTLRRDVDNAEVNDVLAKVLDKTYIPSYHNDLKPNLKKAYGFYIKQMVKKYFYLPLRRFVENDRWNYYYNTHFFEESNILRVGDYVNKNIEQYFIRNAEINHSNKNVLFPLHFRPEATTDYWCDDPFCGSNYEDSVLEVIENSSKNVNFLVKEHPTMYMKRQRQFYERLLEYKNVQIVHPLDNSNETLEKVNIVYVYTGSIGVEALLRSKLVFSKSKNYYSDLHPNVYISDFISENHLKIETKKYDNYEFIKSILRGTMRGTIYNNEMIMDSDIEVIFKQVKEYCSSLECDNNDY